MSADIARELIEFVSTELLSRGSAPEAEVGVDEDLLGSGLIDSLAVMRLVQHIEERFALEIPPDGVTIEHFMTVRLIVGYLESLGIADGTGRAG